MQWTNRSGRAYDEDHDGGFGYAYANGHEGSGSVTADTAQLSWDPAQLAQWTHPTDHTQAMGPGPRPTGMPHSAAAPDLAWKAWDAPHGDVLTVPPTEFAASALPVPGPDRPESASVRPVFVDSSGRRQRRVLRAARLLVIPAGGYVALLISTLLGGPSISSPFVPQPGSPHPSAPRATAPDSTSGAAHSAESASPAEAQQSSSPAAQQTSTATDRSTASTAPSATSAPTVAPTRTTSPASTATPASKGRALGSSHNPVK